MYIFSITNLEMVVIYIKQVTHIYTSIHTCVYVYMYIYIYIYIYIIYILYIYYIV